MHVWFLEDVGRFNQEYHSIQSLANDSPWLLDVKWTHRDGKMTILFTIETITGNIGLELQYPRLFPHAPPVVIPINRKLFLGEHQYRDGTLCLEWGPDNWHHSVVATEVIQSVYRLVSSIDLRTGSSIQELPSRHQLSIGQAARNKPFQTYVDQSLDQFLRQLSYPSRLKIKCAVRFADSKVFVYPTQASTEIRPVKKWGSPYDGKIYAKTEDSGYILVADFDEDVLKDLNQFSVIEKVAHSFGVNLRRTDQGSFIPIFVVNPKHNLECFLIYSLNNEFQSTRCHVNFGNTAGVDHRSPQISSRTGIYVGIVGLGSVGSKIAVSLARSGIQNFLLVDDDLFLPENIVRNELTWVDIALHKVDAVKARIKLINPHVGVNTQRMQLGGQESANVSQNLIDMLGECDILIDATADVRVFNLLANIAERNESTMVWAEVLAGGIGGVIGRSRPRIDPDPQTMRNAFLQYLAEQPKFEDKELPDYVAEVGETSIVASDADVGVVANSCIQLILDSLLKTSAYPYSLYLLGFRQAWIFEQPLHNIPIHVSSGQNSIREQSEELSENERNQILSIIRHIVQGDDDDSTDHPQLDSN